MSLDLDEYLRHQLYLDRLASGQINAHVYPSLEAAYKAIRLMVLDKGVPANLRQLDALTAAIRKEIMGDNGWASFTLDAEAMAKYEAEYQAGLLSTSFEAAVDEPAALKVIKHIDESLMTLTSGKRVDSGVWAKFIEANLESRAQVIDSIVSAGYSNGKTVNQLVKEIGEAFDGILTREAEALARTGFIHYASQANEAVILNNTDILQEYYYAITFDNRLSSVCLGISKFNEPSRRFKVGDPMAPKIPAHWNCRTRRFGVPAGWIPQGTKAAVGGKSGKEAEEAFDKRQERAGDKKVKYRGKKDSNIFKVGQIDAAETYQDWLKRQPEFFIKDTLGAKRAELFMNGMPLSAFSDMTGKPLTLAEIMERNPVR